MKLDRLIAILVVLLRQDRVKANDLARMFDVSVRTILRDIDTLNLAGIPIVTFQGTNGGIGIAEGYRLDKSILTNDEMAAIIATLRGTAGAIPENRYNILIDKIKNALPSAQLKTLNSKTKQFVIDLSPWGGNTLPKNKITDVRKAIEGLQLIEFLYTDASGVSTRRSAEPYSLIMKGHNCYLYAWCRVRQAFRLFKLSRMKDLSVLATHYTPREFSVENLPWESEWQKPDNMVDLELVFEPNLAVIVEEWLGTDTIIHDDGKIMVRVKLPENSWLYGFILSFGAGVEVISPVHIRKIIGETAGQIQKKYL